MNGSSMKCGSQHESYWCPLLTSQVRITASFKRTDNRRSADFQVLRKGLGYCWSVAVVGLPDEGKTLMEKWLTSDDKDTQWIMRENLKKTRLARLDSEWVKKWQVRISR
jgi:hypothetical protein